MREWLSGIMGRKKKESPTYEGSKAVRAAHLEGVPWDIAVHDDDTATVKVPKFDGRGRLRGVVDVTYALFTTDEFLASRRTVDDIRNTGGIVQITHPKPTKTMVINNQTTQNRTVGQIIRDLQETAKVLGIDPLDLQKSKLMAEKALSKAYQERKRE